MKRSLVLPLIALVLSTADSDADTVNARFPRDLPSPESVFTRMFPELPPFAPQTDAVRNAVKLLGARGGLLDALDNLSDPVLSVTNPALSANNPNNAAMTAGITFLGQFLDHDVTLDLRSRLLERAEPRRTGNFRTAAFDLDSVYGDGPERSAELYELRGGDIKFRVESIPGVQAVSRLGAERFDLPRDAGGDAIVADSRNDENTILRDGLKYYDVDGPDRNGRESRETNRGRRPEPRIPVEFSVAAYRFGHSQVRPSYRLNFGASGGEPFFAFVFDDRIGPNDPDPADLRGGKRAPRRFVDWQTFFDFGDGNARPNKRIDAKISTPLMELPGSRAPAPGMPTDGVQSLPSRNLIRHVNFGLPSGQAIARHIDVTALTSAQLAELAPLNLAESTPLWYYVLKEAEVIEGGTRLGPVGARIVGEVFVGLLKADRDSYLAGAPNWKPTLPAAGGTGTFRMADLLRFAGVVPPLQ